MSRIVSMTESALIGIHSLIILAKKTPVQVSSKSLSELTGASENTISKVMQRLSKQGLVTSNRGPAGGFSCAKPIQTISLLDIFEAIEGRLETGHCLFHQHTCIFTSCLFQDTLKNVAEEIQRFLKEKTLADCLQSWMGEE
jgi:Rrf2 family protein